MTFQSLKENNHPQIWIQEMKIMDYLMIGATIRIGREILCLPYAGFLKTQSDKIEDIFHENILNSNCFDFRVVPPLYPECVECCLA